MSKLKSARRGLWLAMVITVSQAAALPPVVLAQTTQSPPQTQSQTPAPPPPPSLGGRQGSTPDAGQPATTSGLPSAQLSSAQFFDQAGFTVDRLVGAGFTRRADLLAARQRLAIAEGRLIQARLRPNPTLSTEYGSPRFLGGEAESDFAAGVSQVFETGGKRRKRVEVARIELTQTRAEVLALERQYAADVRLSYARAVAASRQLDSFERLIAANEDLVRVTNARLKEGDVAPIDLNIVRLETDRLRAQIIRTRADLEGEIISLRALVGFEQTEPLRLAPQPERPPRLDLSLADATDIALRERADLQAARLGEELGTARIRLAESLATPNAAASVRFSRSKQLIDLPERLGGGFALNQDNTLTFGVAIDLPVFNRNQGEIASATGARVQATRQREFLEALIKRDVALAYRRYRAAAESLVIYSTQILPRAEDNIRSVRAAYNLGEFSVFDIVNEQRRLIESQTGYNEALRDYYTALAELERALGTTIPATGFASAQTSVLPDPSPSGGATGSRKAVTAEGLRRSMQASSNSNSTVTFQHTGVSSAAESAGKQASPSSPPSDLTKSKQK